MEYGHSAVKVFNRNILKNIMHFNYCNYNIAILTKAKKDLPT